MTVPLNLSGVLRSLTARLNRSLVILRLTRSCWRATQVGTRDWFYVMGVPTRLSGPERISLLSECYLSDAYGMNALGPRFAGPVADIGANIGAFAVTARRRFADAPIHAYEPAPTIFDCLRRNTEGMNIRCTQVAVAAEAGEVTLVPGFDSTSAFLGTVPGGGGNESGERVRSISLETVVEDCGGTIGLLKLDCEGSEYEILDSPAMKWVNRVAAEVHSGPDMNPERARSSLERQGFQIQRWSGGIVHAQRSNKLF